ALSLLTSDARHRVTCACFFYGFTLDLDGTTAVSDAEAQFRFTNPCRGRTIDDVAAGVPIFLARAGADQFAGVNDAMDRFVAKGLARDLPLTIVNHAGAPHAFDLFHDSETTRAIVRQSLTFLNQNLGARSSE